jgi:3'-phosphoadenosine 5'-phosphosulfate sulfotransferase (PAPS reductase)/FAD synthetase
MDQLSLFEEEPEGSGGADTQSRPEDLSVYDRIIIAVSGGKDSIACVLHLLEEGIEKEKMEMWHHLVDGREGERLMDWPVTEDYCQSVADAMKIDIYFSWKVGGFKGEMLRENEGTNPSKFETPSGEIIEKGGGGSDNTRRKFPQVSGDLAVRWCSPYLKIDVAKKALIAQDRFEHGKTLFVTGERGDESSRREGMAQFEPHEADLRNGKRWQRHIDHWRPIHSWSEEEVWEILQRHRVNPHPAYRLGWGRCSCMFCIFGSDDQMASAAEIDPEMTQRISDYEKEFGTTIKREDSVEDRVQQGTSYDMNEEDAEAAMSESFDEPVFLEEGEWELPLGAFGDDAGPS